MPKNKTGITVRAARMQRLAERNAALAEARKDWKHAEGIEPVKGRSPKWKGGRMLNGNGYVQVWTGPERRYVLEHRLAMERHLGRKLMPWETVHHKNGIRTDNRLENLEHRSSRHGPGQRIEDLPHKPGKCNPFWRLAPLLKA